MEVEVSVLVPVRNEERHLRASVATMRAQCLDEGEVEFLFVDGRSEDATRAILAELARADARIHVLDNPSRRTPQALNIALRHARGRYVARMDAHARYPPRYLARALERLRRGDVEWVSGPQVAHGDGVWSRRVALALGCRLGTGGAAFRRRGQDEFEVDSGFGGVWPRATVDAVGGWDEDWPNDQDFEMAARYRKAGGRIVCLPELAAEYFPRDSLGALARQYHTYGTYRVKTSRRHPESMRPSHVLAPAVVAALVAAVAAPRVVRRAARAAVAGWVGALLAATAGAVRRGAGRDALWLPAILATMHVAWGLGFWNGSRRHGFPAAALLHVVRRLGRRVDQAVQEIARQGRRHDGTLTILPPNSSLSTSRERPWYEASKESAVASG